MNYKAKVDIVVPVCNEENVLGQFHLDLQQVMDTLDYDYRVIYVDDGSTDKTPEMLKELADLDRKVVVVELSRNFGQQAAMSAGLSIATGDYVINMDGDGQHPPELIPEMLSLAEQGYDIVMTRRLDQSGRWTSQAFYKLLNFIGSTQLEPGGPDFRLLNSKAVLAILSMPEYNRFLRGMVAWIGFRSCVIPFMPEKRISGSTKYSFRKLLQLAINAMFSFSLIPLYFAILVGILFLLMALAEIIYAAAFWLSGHGNEIVPGWASLMFVLLLSGGAILINLGIVGIYIGYIYQEVKNRPVFLIRSIYTQQANNFK